VSPEHRRPDGTRQVGPSWESLIERQIREAMDGGAFDDLPHQGSPLPLEDDAAAGEWAMAYRMLKDAGVAPPWIEADKAVRAQVAELDRLLEAAGPATASGRRRRHDDIRRIVAATNAAIARLNAEAPTDRQHRRLLDVNEVLARLDDS
jgi:DnaJ homolog subfamily C member 28